MEYDICFVDEQKSSGKYRGTDSMGKRDTSWDTKELSSAKRKDLCGMWRILVVIKRFTAFPDDRLDVKL